MFEQRLRVYQQEQERGQHRGAFHNRFAATGTVYRNRTCESVFENDKINGAKQARKRHADEIQRLEQEQNALMQRISQEEWHGSVDFVGSLLAEKQTKRELETVCKKIRKLQLQDPEKTWHARMQPLKPEQVGSLAIISYASGQTEEIFNVDPDRCSCGRVYRFECVTHMDICNVCKKCKKVLLAAEDLQTDLLQRGETTKTAKTQKKQPAATLHAPSPLIPTTTNNSTVTHAAPVPSSTKNKNASGLLAYKKYLQQFAEDAMEIPQAVWKVLYESLASVHLLSGIRCKPTSVEDILKRHGFHTFIPHSMRITKMFVGDPIPVLRLDLLARLVQRWDELNQAAMRLAQKQGAKCTLPGKEMLTHVFLVMENENGLASAFAIHKTNNVSQIHTPKFWMVVEECAKESKLSWTYL